MKAAFALLPISTLAACVHPERAEPAEFLVQAPTNWQAAGDGDQGPVRAQWWKQLHNPQLDAAIDHALEHNLDVRATAARLQAAAIQVRLAGAALYPTLSAGLDGSRQRQNFVGLPIPGSNGVLSTTFNNFGVSLNSSWEIDVWGRIRAGRNAAREDFAAAAHDLNALRHSLAAQVAKAFFAVAESKQQLDLAERTVRSFKTTEAQVNDRFLRGVRPALDLRRARTNLRTAEAQVELWGEQLARAKRQLQTLQGKYPDGTNATPPQLPNSGLQVPAGLPAEILQRRPDVLAAERRLLATGFRIDEAKAALYPRISLTSSVGTTSNQFKDLVDGDFFVWNLAGNLLQPIFEGGRLRAQVELATEQERAALADYANAALRAYGEVESALVARSYLDQRGRSLVDAANEAEAARRLSEDRYRSGLVDFLAVSEAQRTALELRSQEIAVRRLRLDLLADLYLALGGGVAPSTPNPSTTDPKQDQEQ